MKGKANLNDSKRSKLSGGFYPQAIWLKKSRELTDNRGTTAGGISLCVAGDLTPPTSDKPAPYLLL
jgi:hypothetical protein